MSELPMNNLLRVCVSHVARNYCLRVLDPQDTHSLEARQTQATGAARQNLTVGAEGSPSSQLGGPQQSPVGSIWAGDDGAESKL